MIPDIELPDNVKIQTISEDCTGEHNQCFVCTGTINGNHQKFFIKVYRTPEINLQIERDILPRLSTFEIPVPAVLFKQDERTPCIGITPIDGYILQDFIDPRRSKYQRSNVIHYLEKYGAMLSRIHALPLSTTPLTRQGLYTLSDEERKYFKPHHDILDWLDLNAPKKKEQVLAHGDFHTAHVFFDSGEVTGVIDWESAGMGWREFDLAWILRARQLFLNTVEEREAILNGYSSYGVWSEQSLKWCEVLIYLHFAFWSKGDESGYEFFALNRARRICTESQNDQQSAPPNAEKRRR